MKNLSVFLLQLSNASVITLSLFFLTLLFSLPLGLLIASGRMSKNAMIHTPIRFYLLVMRGTPLILQLIVFYYGLSSILPFGLPRFWGAVLAFTLNYAAYFAEIYRGGIESISKGQYEAAFVLGFTKKDTFFHIILPQVIKRVLPSMGNEFMTLIKDTALAQTIGVQEMFRLAQNQGSSQFSTIPIMIAGLFYLSMNAIVSKLFVLLEKRLDYYR